MYERCLNEAERILAIYRDPAIPVKKVWQDVNASARRLGFECASLVDFSAMLDADTRFELIPSVKDHAEHQQGLFDEVEESEEELGRLGLSSEDLVRLRRRVVPREDEGEDLGSPSIVRGLSTARVTPPPMESEPKKHPHRTVPPSQRKRTSSPKAHAGSRKRSSRRPKPSTRRRRNT